MISIIKIFKPELKHADIKSFYIWGIPLLAVLMLFLTWKYNRFKWLKLLFGIIGIAIFGVATYKIFTTDMDKLVLNIKIAYGLWFVLVGYLIFGILEIIDLIKMIKGVHEE